MERYCHVVGRTSWRRLEVFPRAPSRLIRRAADATEPRRALVIGQCSLVPWFVKTPKLTYSTNNARFVEIENKASFKHPLLLGKRCIIPARSFDAPNWESGKNAWSAFRRTDGAHWGLAGLCHTWTDKASGKIVERQTMLTLNANACPLMSRMHKLSPKLGLDQQDKRSVVPIEVEDVDQCLYGTQAKAKEWICLPQVELIDASPQCR